ncbi:MAG TPA: hypothetical protein ENJ69_03985, partial [Bacteroidetes bacterium]|nr:hypothetical protein [Bacteroidota bacterium]
MIRPRTSSPHLRRLFGLFSALVLMGMSNLQAQGWEIYFGGANDDMGQAIIQTQDHGFLAIGFSESFSTNYAAFAVRTDIDGTEIWSNVYDDGFKVQAYSVTETNPGKEYLILGDITTSP